jgi:hypothetical protein
VSATELQIGAYEAYVFVGNVTDDGDDGDDDDDDDSFASRILPSSLFLLIVQFVFRYL